MDFFEALKEGARRNYEYEHPFQLYTEGAASAIDATIEALKDLMVGEPIRIGPRYNPLWSKAVLKYDRLEWARDVSPRWIRESRMAAIQMLAVIMGLLRDPSGGEVTVVVLRDAEGKAE